MKRTKYLLIFILPFVFIPGCIDGLTAFSINKDGSGMVTFEGLFDYPAYSAIVTENNLAVSPFFLEQIKTMLTSGGFEAWDDVTWKFLDDGRCYFKGTAYFKDINKTDFFFGSAESNFKILFDRRQQEKPTLELKCSAQETIPPELFETVRVSLVVTLPGNIERAENFELLDPQTATFVFDGKDLPKIQPGNNLSEYFRNKGTIKLVLASAGKDLFDYQTQVLKAQKEYKKILENIQIAQMAENTVEENSLDSELNLRKHLNAQLRSGLLAQGQKNFERAIKIYENIIDNAMADKKYKSRASYQIGMCLFESHLREQAVEQFEFILDNYPLQRAAVLKSLKMLQDIDAGKIAKEKQEKEPDPEPFVVDETPGLYAEDVNSSADSITIVFSEPMKKTEWFYSSFSPALMPKATGAPVFDEAGLEWTLPVKLKPGKIYAIAVNCGDAAKSIKNLQTSFRSVSGQKCGSFILVFATADAQQEPTLIDDKLIERCEEVNFGQEN